MSLKSCERLTGDDDLIGFDCGVDSLNDWLRRAALNLDRQGLSRTFVGCDPESGSVDRYFALTIGSMRKDEIPTQFGTGGPAAMPIVRIAKLGLDRRLHGRGAGADLLVEAVRMAVVGISTLGGRLIVVDALTPEVVGFYRRHDFTQFGSSTILGLKASAAAKAVGMPWP